MKIKFIFGILFLCFFSCDSKKNNELYQQISYYHHPTSKKKSVDQIIEKQQNGEFLKDEIPKFYKKLGNDTWWYHFKINKGEETQFFTVANTYLSYGKLFIKTNDSIRPLQGVSYYKNQPHKQLFYKHPVWKIKLDKEHTTDVFLKLINRGGRTRLAFHLETENEFLKRIETAYILESAFVTFLICMILILLFFALLKKEYSVLFYGFYIFCLIIEFLAGKGLGVQFFWSDSSFLTNNIRSLIQTCSVVSIGLFYLNFYNFPKKNHINKNIFKWGVYVTIPFLCVYLYKYFFGGLGSFYLLVWIVLKAIAVVWLINHLYLIKKKIIPLYLVFAFVFPIISIVISQQLNPSVYSPKWLIFTSHNIYYLAVILEVLLFTRYIFDAVIKTQLKYEQLKKVSDELKYSFQNKTIEIQEKERNNLLNNVHDSFSGYLEALKIRLLSKSKNSPEKIQEILDAFYKEYRFLLNNLYSPKINSYNLIENLLTFCEKLNEITNDLIKPKFSLKDSSLSSEKCMHIYRIISELTTNAIKYSKASEIQVHIFNDSKEGIIIEVSDNGTGFVNDKKDKNSYGLESIKNRTSKLNGLLEISSIKNKGTSIIIKIPKNDN